jgi:hypothetical protein
VVELDRVRNRMGFGGFADDCDVDGRLSRSIFVWNVGTLGDFEIPETVRVCDLAGGTGFEFKLGFLRNWVGELKVAMLWCGVDATSRRAAVPLSKKAGGIGVLGCKRSVKTRVASAHCRLLCSGVSDGGWCVWPWERIMSSIALRRLRTAVSLTSTHPC